MYTFYERTGFFKISQVSLLVEIVVFNNKRRFGFTMSIKTIIVSEDRIPSMILKRVLRGCSYMYDCI